MWLIIGLGNPGTEYAGTYHNAGFRVLERIAASENIQINEPCGPALISAKTTLGAQSAVLVLPQTYMNNSGAVISPLFERFEATIRDVIVVYDDVALPLGKIRIRQKGSAGGHNGIKSLISAFGSGEFLRIRIGIQPDRSIGGVRDFVLSEVAKIDRDLLDRSEEIAARAVLTLVAEGVEKAMSQYNGVDLRQL
ncbi:MAG: aminoacyl-tRNA hydrolase [Acidobacteria bacterium 13_1_40CM_56_16]|nr:MAG: aminoacyl-tRNA hydrolase [Acidobacteria bacterium 13_1_40CM_56_16]